MLRVKYPSVRLLETYLHDKRFLRAFRHTPLRHELGSLTFNLRTHDVLCRPENGTNCSQQIFVDITIVNTNIKVKTHNIDRRGLWLTVDGLINPVESTSEDNKDR